MILRFVSAIVICVSIFSIAIAKEANEVSPDWQLVKKKLQKLGFKKPFIEALEAGYESDDFKTVLGLNTLLFLRKDDYHGKQVTGDSVERIRWFIDENQKTLQRAEKEKGVPASIIASLLWIESRYGQNPGRFHVPSVYVQLLQADRPEVIRYLQTDGALKYTPKISKRTKAKIAERAKKKSKWALEELKAIEKIYMEHGKVALTMRGSFSGAYGMPQFLPSSYVQWARAKKPDTPPDLTNKDDAILSVANFLHTNGWRKTRTRTHLKALMNYNNSEDYAKAILRLAKRTQEAMNRRVADLDRGPVVNEAPLERVPTQSKLEKKDVEPTKLLD